MRNKKLLALYLVLILILTAFPAYAEEESVTLSDPVSEMLLCEVSNLENLESGVDYAEGQGFFLASSREEAEKTAADYDAYLTYYSNGVARVRFKGTTVSSLKKAASGKKAKIIIEPDYYFEIDEESVELVSPVQDPFTAESPYYQYHHRLIGSNKALEICSGNGVKVAVIDTGVNPEHEDLQGKVSVNYIPSLKKYAGIDIQGHGTHVCGLIAAIKDNGLGGYGVAPGVSIDSIQITEDGKFKLSAAAEGVRMAIDRGADIINMSFGSDQSSLYLRKLLSEASGKGIILVAAAGNNRSGSTYYPAGESNVIAVGSVTDSLGLAEFSNWGDWVDIAAPGFKIYSSYIYKPSKTAFVTGTNSTDSYGMLKGTSQSAPMVTGTAALCLSASPELFHKKTIDKELFIREAVLNNDDGNDYTYDDGAVTRYVKGLLRSADSVNAVKDLKPSERLSLMDPGSFKGSFLSGQIVKGKSIKLKILNESGSADKKLLKNAKWTSSRPDIVTVKKGKIKALKKAKTGETALITADINGEKLYFAVEVMDPVKKIIPFTPSIEENPDSISSKKSCTVDVSVGSSLDISDPCIAAPGYSVFIFSKYKKKDLYDSLLYHSVYADGRIRYKITISKKDLKKVTINKTGDNLDPLNITVNAPGTVKVKYKLLDGSNKKFVVKYRCK